LRWLTTDNQTEDVLEQPLKALNFHLSWREIVSTYTRRELTYATDKLIALRGLIDAIRDRTNLPDIAGMWLPTLTHDLLWSTNPYTMRCKLYRAPSWSWVSVDGPVSYEHEPTSMADVRISDLSVRSTSVTGQITAATILLSGYARTVYLSGLDNYHSRFGPPVRKRTPDYLDTKVFRLSSTASGNEKDLGYVILDDPEQMASLHTKYTRGSYNERLRSEALKKIKGRSVICLRISTVIPAWQQKASTRNMAEGVVVLDKIKGQDQYVRVGMGYILRKNWFDKVHLNEFAVV
jgi:hypothetical protein